MSNNKKDFLSKEEQELLDIFKSSCLSIEDIRWIKNKRWFKKFLKLYIKELKKLNIKENSVETKKTKIPKEDLEILDFTQTINIPNKEIIEILDFTQTVDISKVKEINKISEKAKKKLIFEKNLLWIILIVCIISIIFLSLYLFNNENENKNLNDISNDIYEISTLKDIELEDTSIISEEESKEDLYEKYGSLNLLDVNLESFKDTNTNVKGWIKVKGTKINYPFVQTTNNEYYLKHSFDNEYNKKGWVFLDFRNDIENLKDNTVIYAHGLVNNQMFGSLRNVFKNSWFSSKENHIIQTVGFNYTQLWEVFSVYTIEPESYYITTNFENKENYSTFLDTIKLRSLFDFEVSVNSNDKILTLSSCYNNEKRMVLHAKLIANQKK